MASIEERAERWALEHARDNDLTDFGPGIEEELVKAYLAGAKRVGVAWSEHEREAHQKRLMTTGFVNLDHFAQGRYLDSIQAIEAGRRRLVWIWKQPKRDPGEYLVDIDGTKYPRPDRR